MTEFRQRNALDGQRRCAGSSGVVYGCVRCPGDARIGCRICSVFLLCLCGGKQGQQQSMRRDTHDHGGYALFGSENQQPAMEQVGKSWKRTESSPRGRGRARRWRGRALGGIRRQRRRCAQQLRCRPCPGSVPGIYGSRFSSSEKQTLMALRSPRSLEQLGGVHGDGSDKSFSGYLSRW